ncbi:MAG: hypothetical protein AAF541_19595 [Pseudomonadota bacterium]
MSELSGKERRKQQVLAAVEDSIRESGSVSFSMKELAQKAHVSFATPFNLFGKKEDILVELLNTHLVHQTQGLEARAAKGKGLENLMLVAVDSCEGYLADQELFRPLLQSIHIRPTERGRGLVSQAQQMWKEALQNCLQDKTIEPDVDLDSLARQIHLGFRMAVWMWASDVLSNNEFRNQAVFHTLACLLPCATTKGTTLIKKFAKDRRM